MSSIKLKHSGGNAVSLHPPTSAPSASDVQFKLPTADGTAGQVLKSDGSGNLGFVSQSLAGITEFDMWNMTGNHSADSGSPLNNSLVRVDTSYGAAQIGTGMTKDASTGVFTFPSTGKWVIFVNVHMYLQGDDNAGIGTQVTTNNSSYTTRALAYIGQHEGSSTAQSACSIFFLDVTDTSNVKVRFVPDSLATDSYITGSSTYVRTSFTFVRIGDT